MRLIKTITTALIIIPSFFSCNNSTIAGKPATKEKKIEYRSLTDSERSFYAERFEKFFDSLLLHSGGFSGGILVAKNNEILYENYVGYSDAYRQNAVTDTTPFHIASTSKTFTSTAVLQLVQAGKLSLDDSVNSWFPQFPYPGLTIKNLLNHSSGIPYYANFMDHYGWDRSKTATNADVLNTLYTYKPPREFSPGARFRYCNTNFVLLALLVEKIAGQPYPDVIRDSIFIPCGMTHSYVVSERNPGAFLPSFVGRRAYGFDYLDAVYGDKNVFSTCRDLAKYDSCIRDQVIIGQPLYDQATTPYYKDLHYRSSNDYYGLGWRLKFFTDSAKIAYHNGWWHGNNSVFQRVLADTAVIIVTGNRFTTRIYQAAKAANIFRPYYSRGAEVEDSQADTFNPAEAEKKKTVVPSSSRRRHHATKSKKASSRKKRR